MKDPHVKAVHYKLRSISLADFSDAQPLEYENADFKVRVADSRAVVEMKKHYSTHEEALEAVQPFLESWELGVGLETGKPGMLSFSLQSVEMTDQSLPPSAKNFAFVVPERRIPIRFRRLIREKQDRYPAPVEDLYVTTDVRWMYDRWAMYCKGSTHLNDLSNFCITVLKASAGGMKNASQKYRISERVLRTLSQLSATKGGGIARKAEGACQPLSRNETAWMEAAVIMLIRRAGEIGAKPDGDHPQITLDDLPSLISQP